ncbi:MAG: hypothetical protein LBQ10_04695 [Desulfovibrio sp.]|jgi:hypothetical protein|nr:hypothetical protein [Desulfovibrio sp.]
MRFYVHACLIGALLLSSASGCSGKLSPGQPDYVDAVELKLKCRELADQMLATMPNDALQGFVAMPTAFVEQNNSSQSSPLGRLIAESMFYEFNQRGFPTREYRLTGHISVVGGRDDLALAANQIVPTRGQKWAALIVGTYYVEKRATFVNARLVRAGDGLVLRTGQLVLANTPVVARMGKADAPLLPLQKADGTAAGGANAPDPGKVKTGTKSPTAAAGRNPHPPLYTPADAVSTGKIRIVQGR